MPSPGGAGCATYSQGREGASFSGGLWFTGHIYIYTYIGSKVYLGKMLSARCSYGPLKMNEASMSDLGSL